MVNYREILRLNSFEYTQLQIAASVHSSRNTVSDVIKLASNAGISWTLDDFYTNEVLYAALYPKRLEAVNPRKESDYNYIHKELAHGNWLEIEHLRNRVELLENLLQKAGIDFSAEW